MQFKIVDGSKLDNCKWFIIHIKEGLDTDNDFPYGLVVSCDNTYSKYRVGYFQTLEHAQERAKTIKNHQKIEI